MIRRWFARLLLLRSWRNDSWAISNAGLWRSSSNDDVSTKGLYFGISLALVSQDDWHVAVLECDCVRHRIAHSARMPNWVSEGESRSRLLKMLILHSVHSGIKLIRRQLFCRLRQIFGLRRFWFGPRPTREQFYFVNRCTTICTASSLDESLVMQPVWSEGSEVVSSPVADILVHHEIARSRACFSWKASRRPSRKRCANQGMNILKSIPVLQLWWKGL